MLFASKLLKPFGVAALVVILSSYSASAQSNEYRKGVEFLRGGYFQSALEILEPLATNNDPMAQHQLAIYYLFNSTEADEQIGMEWLKSSAELGYVVAQDLLGELYYLGHKTQRNLDEALKWHMKAAMQGNANSQYRVGQANDFGAVEPNYEQALKWYMLSAEQNNADAQAAIGTLYFLGSGVPKDLKKSFEWALKAAKNGSARGQNTVGDMYFSGSGTLQDYKLAHMWTNIANSNGDYFAKTNLPIITSKLSADQLAEAQSMAAKCLESKYTACGY